MAVSNLTRSFDRYDGRSLNIFKNKGGFWFLPQSWQGAIANEEVAHDNIWYSFLIGTLKRTEENLKKINTMALGSYVVALILADLLLFASKRSNGSLFVRSILRMIFTHGLVLAFGFYLLHTVQESNWAKDIQSEKAFRLPVYVPVETDLLLPETIPISSDILIAPQYASDYLAGYAKVLEYAHRGNQFWKQATKEYSSGYADLPEALQQDFCADLMQSVQSDRRFLQQDLTRSWIPVDDEEELSYICRKALVAAKSSLLEALVYQVEALRAEALYGRFQSTAMTDTISPEILGEWEKTFVPPISLVPKAKQNNSKNNNFLPRSFAVITNAQKLPASQKQPVPPRPPSKEPYPGAWLQSGDIVEGRYGCNTNGKGFECHKFALENSSDVISNDFLSSPRTEWYTGSVLHAMANNARYDVQYDDGDINYQLMAKCVRRFVPYVVGDSTEVREDGNIIFYPGSVTKVHDDGLYDVLTQGKKLYERVGTRDMRRTTKTNKKPFKVGDRVMAQFEKGEEWFPGEITKKNEDKTYAIKYDDGDVDKALPAKNIARED
jgi:hypothetical protein